MENDKIKAVLMNALPLQEVYVINNGKHFQVIAVSEIFDGMSSIRKQQVIYAPLVEYIMNNYIHALSIKAYTPIEWERNYKLKNFLSKDANS